MKKYKNWDISLLPLSDETLDKFSEDGWNLEHFQVVNEDINIKRFYYIFSKEV